MEITQTSSEETVTLPEGFAEESEKTLKAGHLVLTNEERVIGLAGVGPVKDFILKGDEDKVVLISGVVNEEIISQSCKDIGIKTGLLSKSRAVSSQEKVIPVLTFCQKNLA